MGGGGVVSELIPMRSMVGFAMLDQTRKNGETMALGHPPAHRDKTAMNGAQLFTAHSDSDDRATCP